MYYIMEVPDLTESQSVTSDVSKTESEGSITETTHEQELFKKAVREYILIDDQMADYRKEISIRNKRKKVLSEIILKFMNKTQKDTCNIGESGSLEVKQRKSTVTIKKDYVENTLNTLLKDENKAKEYADVIFQNREVKFIPTLKRYS